MTNQFTAALEALTAPVTLYLIKWRELGTWEVLASKAEAEISAQALRQDGQTVSFHEFRVPTDDEGLARFLNDWRP